MYGTCTVEVSAIYYPLCADGCTRYRGLENVFEFSEVKITFLFHGCFGES